MSLVGEFSFGDLTVERDDSMPDLGMKQNLVSMRRDAASTLGLSWSTKGSRT